MTQASTRTAPEMLESSDLAGLDPAALRAAFRAGRFRGMTTGLAPGRLQCNLVVLPQRWARDFAAYCRANPQPCPLLYEGHPGAWRPDAFGPDIDLRSDLPAYRVHRDGFPAETVSDIGELWREDFVPFLLGCSLSFEEALVADGIRLRHLERGGNLAAYRTNRRTRPAGPFAGDLVVTMRPIAQADVARAGAITARYPHAHGAPVHAGDAADLGIADVERPDWGDAPDLDAGEVPVFWACGVTSQLALAAARVPLCITHEPGSMLVSDLPADRPPTP